jgi:hypothetical protein
MVASTSAEGDFVVVSPWLRLSIMAKCSNIGVGLGLNMIMNKYFQSCLEANTVKYRFSATLATFAAPGSRVCSKSDCMMLLT